jgi:hypothetical protein
VLTAATMNSDVRDNFLEMSPGQVTSSGDMVYADAANSMARVAKPSAKSMMFYSSTAVVPVWSTDGTRVADLGHSIIGTTQAPTTTYTNYISSTFTFPSEWVTADVLAWGSAGIANIEDALMQWNVRMRIGTDSGTAMPTGSLGTGEDALVFASHLTTGISANTTIHTAGLVSGATFASSTQTKVRWANLAWMAVRRS